MARSKLSPTQLRKATVGPGIKAGAGCTVQSFHVVADVETELSAWEWEVTRDELWAELACEGLFEHAESLGPGTHRYVVRTYDAAGKQKQSTWARVIVERERAAPSSDGSSSSTELDGSVEAFMRILQEGYIDERKARHESLKLVHDLMKTFSAGLAAVHERANTLELELAKRDAEKPAAPPQEETSGSDIFLAALATMGPALGEKLGEVIGKAVGPTVAELAPSLVKMASGMVDGASTGAQAVVDVPTTPELPS